MFTNWKWLSSITCSYLKTAVTNYVIGLLPTSLRPDKFSTSGTSRQQPFRHGIQERRLCFIWKLNYFVSSVARWIHELHYLSHYVTEMTHLNASAIHLWCHFVASNCAFTSVMITWRRLYQTLKFLRFFSVLYTSHYTTPFSRDFLTGEGNNHKQAWFIGCDSRKRHLNCAPAQNTNGLSVTQEKAAKVTNWEYPKDQ